MLSRSYCVCVEIIFVYGSDCQGRVSQRDLMRAVRKALTTEDTGAHGGSVDGCPNLLSRSVRKRVGYATRLLTDGSGLHDRDVNLLVAMGTAGITTVRSRRQIRTAVLSGSGALACGRRVGRGHNNLPGRHDDRPCDVLKLEHDLSDVKLMQWVRQNGQDLVSALALLATQP